MSDTRPMVRLSRISKGYGSGETDVRVLHELDLQIAEGELLAVVGPSGVGKSTLLHLVGLLDRPDTGSIEIDGSDVGEINGTARAGIRNRTLGFVFQHHHLLDEMDARDNVALPLRIAGKPAREARLRADALLEKVDLSGRSTHFPDQLSGGEQQRVALARALVMRPRLLLADEPTGNLDRASAESVFELVRQLHLMENLTSIIVTHNEAVASRCDRIFRLAPLGERSGYVREV
ncbi:MAG: ABC transporter ATP-binding protein [Thermoanaerobaculales bacterium]|nr:ABC transporter ATP-binding protein [Thermoanaerobaculales bacterium]